MTAEQAASIIKEDLNSFVRSELERAFNEAFADFASKWSKPYPKPMLSLVEKQDAMLAFYEFPKAMRKAICTSNAAESLNSAAKRKTGGRIQYNSEDSALIVLAKVYEDCNRDARPAKFMLEMSEDDKRSMGFTE